jgi:DNA-binding YbaB/EbfC family protein
MLKGLGGLGDMAKMMKAAQDMQAKMAELQETLARTPVQGEAGAGLVRAIVTGKGELTGLSIDPSIFSAEDREVVEDLVIAAIKDAQTRARAKAAEEMERLTQSLGLPAGVKLPF